MSKYPGPEEFKNLLLSIYPCKVPFELLVVDKKLKTNRKTYKRTVGSYYPSTYRIRIYARGRTNGEMKTTAIHEYAHHIHYTVFNKVKRRERSHGPKFREIYRMLICRAMQKKVLDGKDILGKCFFGAG